MVQGIELLAAIVRDKDRSALKKLKPDWLQEEELPLYTFVMDHTRQYKKIPSSGTCKDHGFSIKLPTEPVDYYLDLVRDRVTYNIVRSKFKEIKDSMKDNDPKAAVESMKQAISLARAEVGYDDLMNMSSLEEKAEFRRQYYENLKIEGLKGVPTGWPVLDEATSGMQKGDLLILCGRPNVGKSYLLQHMAISAWKQGYTVLFVSMEMSKDQIRIRVYSHRAKINPTYVRDAILTTQQRKRLFNELREVEAEELGTFYVMAGDLDMSISQIELTLQELKPDALYIDAGYLVRDDNSNPRANKYEKVADAANAMKKLAIRADIPIATSIQLGRNAEPTEHERKKHKFKDPTLANVGFTDELGQLCSIAIGVVDYSREIRKLVIMKNRDGMKPSFFSWFNFRLMDFSQMPETMFDKDTGKLMDDDALDVFM